ncbi:hypothetical protein [Nocardia cyriacigeorgica]|uniref:hypothetical protein n=1 Tax=Nocardia cyriacigeorgica TaxID=135487 RepID=UPI0024553DC2|nr:hypothetical protein [Nocardia cyriacigeorgica]
MTSSESASRAKRAVNPIVAEAAARHRKRRRPRKTSEPQQLALFDLPARSPRHDHQDQQPA